MTAAVWRGLCFTVAILGAAVGVTDRKVYRGDRVRRLLIALVLYAGVGMFTVVALVWPWSLVGGLATDAILLYAGFQAVRVWDSRLLHLDPIERCPVTVFGDQCDGMLGHLGPHLFTYDEGGDQ